MVFFGLLYFSWFVLSIFEVLILFSLRYYFIIFYNYPVEACLFSNVRKKGSGSGWEGGREGLGQIEGGETVIRIHSVRKESISNQREN